MSEQPDAATDAAGAVQPAGQLQPVAAALSVHQDDSTWGGRENRRLERFPALGTRPIALRPLAASGAPAGPWVLADILDISLGGMCLLVTGSLHLDVGQALLLDLRSHPSFGQVRLEVQARWWALTDSFSTIGVRFPGELASLPHLELERRTVRRDPNREPWAQA